MKKVAIVGVEGSGKTVMLAGLGELYLRPDVNGYFLSPKNFATASYVADKIVRMRAGEWPIATAEDVLQGLNWTLKRKNPRGGRPEEVCEISCLDFAGEVYRNAFGINAESGTVSSNEAAALKDYIRAADAVIVLINLRDIIAKGMCNPRVQEAIWITRSILQYALDDAPKGHEPRVALALTQADSYADTIRSYGGAWGVVEAYLPDVANNYDWLDTFEVSAVDRTRLDDDGNVVPAEDFTLFGLMPIVDWILENGRIEKASYVEPSRQRKYLPSSDESDDEEPLRRENRPRRRAKIIAVAVCALVAISVLAIYFCIYGYDLNFISSKYPERGAALKSSEGKMVPYPTAEDREQGTARYVSTSLYCDATEQDCNETVEWCRKAAENGDAHAQYKLGGYYHAGVGVEKDVEEALKWYRKAANHGYVEAQNMLGCLYYYGQEVERNFKEAVKWYRMAAEQGNAQAQDNLGVCYQYGCGVDSDLDEAAKWYNRAADSGHPQARDHLKALKAK